MITKKAVIVLRRSTGSQDVSFSAQEADCRRLCEEQGWEVKSVHKDTASGSVNVDKRPGLLAALQDLKRNEFLVARSASRLSRDLATHLAIEDEVKRKRAQIFFVDGGLSDDDPQRVLMRTIRAAFNSYELALMSFRTKSALSRLRKEGRALGAPGRIRFGFSRSEDGTTLIENPEEMKIVHRVWDLSQRGVGGLKITEVLTAEGYTTRKGKPFHFSFIYKMIKTLKDHPDLYPFLKAA
jgi:DNA invertase Pin-like site-specific DNA recombinase